MRCPLCSGPLHVEDQARFRCERGHDLDPTALRLTVGARVTSALWMGIEALESEAEALRLLATFEDDEGAVALAEQAEQDARTLRAHRGPSAGGVRGRGPAS